MSLSLENLTFKPTDEYHLNDISLNFEPGKMYTILGRTLSGKTTLLKTIAGLLTPDSGTIYFEGNDFLSIPVWNRNIAMVYQQFINYPHLNVQENIEFPLEMMGMDHQQRKEKVQYFVELVGLQDFADSFPHQLSGGMRQRICIARTLAYEPDILLLDEPFAALDEQTRMLLGDQLTEICARLKQTSLLITHNISYAVHLWDRVVMLSFRPGKIIDVIPVDLPRPRSSDQLGSDAFSKLVGQIWGELKVEANKGLAES